MLKIIDNFFEENIFKKILDFCEDSPYYYGECDKLNVPPVGMISDFAVNSDISLLFHNKLINFDGNFKKLELYRSYINCFLPNENPFFHTDSDNGGITCLYYCNKNFDIDEGGETQFIINDEIRGIFPIPNRMVIFDSYILHKATSFRSRYRFSIAIKYT